MELSVYLSWRVCYIITNGKHNTTCTWRLHNIQCCSFTFTYVRFITYTCIKDMLHMYARVIHIILITVYLSPAGILCTTVSKPYRIHVYSKTYLYRLLHVDHTTVYYFTCTRILYTLLLLLNFFLDVACSTTIYMVTGKVCMTVRLSRVYPVLHVRV